MIKKNKILIVDDKNVNIQILSRFLKKYGYEIKTSESGIEALKVVQTFVPDVVLMDICMPGMDGIECISKMKEILTENFYVIFITAIKDIDTKRRAFEVGATSYINKPVDLKLLKKTIDKCLNVDQAVANNSSKQPKADEPKAKTKKPFGDDTDTIMLQQSKMNTLGQLSSSVAHDINNFLGGILGNVSLIELSTEDEEILSCCREIKKAVSNTSELTETLTAYSKKEPANRKFVNLSDSLYDAINLIDRDARYLANVSQDIINNELMVKGVYSELTNIFLNILKNAYQAVDDSGNVTISLTKEVVNSKIAVYKDHLNPGEYAKVVIADDGCGISKEVLSHICEPFFTTKEDGTGLGLSSTHKYLQKNNGALDITSEPGKGTTVSLYFKVSGTGVGKTLVRFAKENVDMDLEGLRIVVMDDDVIFCNSISGYLKKYNASVISFTDKSFLDFLNVNPFLAGYDILIVDFKSPYFNSVELIEELTKENDRLNCYIVSGSELDVSDIERCGFFRKPLNFAKMAEQLQLNNGK